LVPLGSKQLNMLLGGSDRDREIQLLVGASPAWFAFWAICSCATLFVSYTPAVLLVWASALGIVAAALVVLSLRYYHWLWSRFCWLPPLLPILLLADLINTGVLSVVSIGAAVGVGEAVAFALLWLFRNRLQQWLHGEHAT
jgi:hypothetical protein